jgi:hypothetical protein
MRKLLGSILVFSERKPRKAPAVYFSMRVDIGSVLAVSTQSLPTSNKIELAGSALGLQNTGDIVGTYGPAASGTAIVSGSKAARLRTAASSSNYMQIILKCQISTLPG